MPNSRSSTLLERISHMTQSRPFSIHHIHVSAGEELILYLHWHSEAEFFFVQAGETVFHIEDQQYALKAGEAIFIPGNLLHKATSLNGSGCEFYAVVFSTSFLLESHTHSHYAKYLSPVMHYNLRCVLPITPSVPWQHEVLTVLKSIHQVSSQPTIEHWELQMHGSLLIIWQWLYNHHLSQIEMGSKLSGLAKQLEQSIALIHQSYGEDLTLQQLAETSHLSQGQFCRLFKQLTGTTPFGYLNRYRVLKSCDYLSRTTKKVAEIAALCGFNNISFYNREFTKYMQSSPSAYRKATM